jgi:hypothetical protein
MKKGLLFTLAIGTTLGVTAQNARKYNPNGKMVKNHSSVKIGNDVSTQASGYAPTKGIVNSPLVASVEIDLGNAPNAYGSIGGSRCNLWADPVLNAVAFTHRFMGLTGALTGQSGFLAVDVSTDGGLTFNNDLGPVYSAAGLFTNGIQDSSAGRYPHGLIVNSSPTNTNPANAHISYFMAIRDNSNPAGAADWGGIGFGTAKLDGTMPNQTTTHSGKGPGKTGVFTYIPEDFFATRQGVTWGVSESRPNLAGTNTYNDTILVWKNTVATGAPVYSLTKIAHPVIRDGARGVIGSTKIAFDATGQKGWIATLSTIKDSAYFNKADSSTSIILFKTVDGGNTWSAPIAVIPATFQNVKDSLPQLDTTKAEVGVYGCSFDLDLVVDKYGNPHMQTGVGVSVKADQDGPKPTYNSWSFASGNFAQFAFYSTDGGVSFKAHMLDRPKTFRGCFGDCAGSDKADEDNRGQISISWDGQTIYHTWFDTDTLTAGVSDNSAPNAHTKFLYLTSSTETWSVAKNITPIGAPGNAAIVQGNVSYYLLGTTPATYTVPISFSKLSNNSVIDPVAFSYLGGLNFFTSLKTSREITISSTITPNPTSGVSNLNYSLTENGTVVAELYNVIGEKLAVLANENQVAGAHNLNINLSNYNNGLYIVRMNVNGVSTAIKVVKN